MSSTPKIRFNPRARRASTPPRRMPLMAASTRKIGSIIRIPLPHWGRGLPFELRRCPLFELKGEALKRELNESRMPESGEARAETGEGDSYAEVGLAHEVLLRELVRPALHFDAPDLEQVRPVHELEHLANVLLDHEDRVALFAHAADQVEDAEDHHGGEAQGRLVEQDDLGARHDGAPEGQHLLLAARHAPRALVLALGEDGKERVDALQALAVVGARRRQEGAHLEIVRDGEAGEEAAPFGHVRDSV